MTLPVPDQIWRWPHFTPDEMRCKGDGSLAMDEKFMDKMEALRSAYGKPMLVTSGYRSPKYNNAVGETGSDGPHTHGRAIDIAVYGADAYRLVSLALSMGFTGIGINQKGPLAGRFIHLDDLTAEDKFPRPVIWTY